MPVIELAKAPAELVTHQSLIGQGTVARARYRLANATALVKQEGGFLLQHNSRGL